MYCCGASLLLLFSDLESVCTQKCEYYNWIKSCWRIDEFISTIYTHVYRSCNFGFSWSLEMKFKSILTWTSEVSRNGSRPSYELDRWVTSRMISGSLHWLSWKKQKIAVLIRNDNEIRCHQSEYLGEIYSRCNKKYYRQVFTLRYLRKIKRSECPRLFLYWLYHDGLCVTYSREIIIKSDLLKGRSTRKLSTRETSWWIFSRDIIRYWLLKRQILVYRRTWSTQNHNIDWKESVCDVTNVLLVMSQSSFNMKSIMGRYRISVSELFIVTTWSLNLRQDISKNFSESILKSIKLFQSVTVYLNRH